MGKGKVLVVDLLWRREANRPKTVKQAASQKSLNINNAYSQFTILNPVIKLIVNFIFIRIQKELKY